MDEHEQPHRSPLLMIVDLNATLAIEPTTNECLWDGDEPSYVDIIDALVRVDDLA